MKHNTSEINIFLASSGELADERIIAGSVVAELNDRFEPYGLRVRLLCWEDFPMSYRGKRTQSMYNEYLVKPSTFVLALFHKKCGEYTVEEIDTAIKNSIPVVCFQKSVPGEQIPDEITDLYSSKGLKPKSFSSADELRSLITAEVENHVKDKKLLLRPKTVNGISLYGSVARDVALGRERLRNLVRKTDDSFSKNSLRVRLFPYGTPKFLRASFSHIGLIRETADPECEKEIDTALSLAESGSLDSALFVGNYNVFKDTPFGLRIKKERDIFFPKLDEDMLKVKEHLDMLLRRFIPMQATPLDSRIVGDTVMFEGQPVMGQDMVKAMCAGRLQKIDEHFKDLPETVDKDLASSACEDEKRDLLLRAIRHSSFLVEAVNSFDIDPKLIPDRIMDSFRDHDYEAILHEVDYEYLTRPGAAAMEEHEKPGAIALCSLLLKCLIKAGSPENTAGTIQKLLSTRLDLLDFYVRIGEEDIASERRLATLAAMASLSLLMGKEVDQRIVRQLDSANGNNLAINRLIGRIRLSQAKELAQSHSLHEAWESYGEVLKLLKRISPAGNADKLYYCRSLLDSVEPFMGISEYDNLIEIRLKEAERVIHNAKTGGESFDVCRTRLAATRHRLLSFGREDLPRGEAIISNDGPVVKYLIGRTPFLSMTDSHDLAYSANIMGAFYTDRDELIPDFFEKAMPFYRIALDILEHEYEINPYDAAEWLAQCLHNLGFHHAKKGLVGEAAEYYRKTLGLRESLFHIENKNPIVTGYLAETCVNLGAILMEERINLEEAARLAGRAIELRKLNLRRGDDEDREKDLYIAVQLLGTILLKSPATFREGISCLQRVWDWAVRHPENHYYGYFREFSYNNLHRLGIVD